MSKLDVEEKVAIGFVVTASLLSLGFLGVVIWGIIELVLWATSK